MGSNQNIIAHLKCFKKRAAVNCRMVVHNPYKWEIMEHEYIGKLSGPHVLSPPSPSRYTLQVDCGCRRDPYFMSSHVCYI